MSQMITSISNGFFITGIYMRRLNSLITLVLILLACQFACAETIFETFDTDPLTRGWIMENPAGSVFTYNPRGYIEATIARNPTLKDRYMKALSQIYYMPKSDMNSTVSDIWLELDVLYIEGDERTQGQIGVMKSDSVQGIGGNGIVIDIIKDLVAPGTGPYRIDEHMYFTGGTGYRYCTGTPGGSFTKVPNRVKTHIYYDPNDHWVKVMELKVYEIAPDGSLTLVSELTGTWNGISAGGGESCQVDAFGIFNLSGAVTPTPQSFYIDNIYFSTDGPNASSPRASFGELLVIEDVTARTTTNSIQIDTLVRNVVSEAISCKIRNRLYEDQDTNRPAFLDVTSVVTSIPGDTNTTITSSNTGLSPALWAPDNPTCYLLITDLIDSNTDGLLERREAVIGFRTFTVNGNHFELNGRTIYLRGYAQMPPGRIPGTMTSDPAFINQHIDRLKQNNINIVRMAGPATDNEAWITACDRLGMMVMAGCYSGCGSTDPNLSYNLSVLQGEIAKFKNCPSVVAWITANEYAGPSSSLQSLYDAAKALDPTRLVFAAASSGTASDFIDRHNYLGWYYGSVYSLYSIAYTDSLPVTYTECVGAYTNLDVNDGSFQVNADKLIDSALRAIGHSHSFAADSLWYQAYLTREWIEIVHRARGSSSSIAGLLPFTNGYSYNYQTKTETPKPLFTEIQKAYKTIHVSIECQCPHVFAGSTLSAQLYVLNDDPNGTQLPASTLYVDLLNSAGTSIYNTSYALSAINYYGTAVQPVTFVVPSLAATGTYSLRARLVTSTELDSSESGICVAQSAWTQVKNKTVPAVALYDPAGSTVSVLQSLGAPVQVISNFSNLSSYQGLIIGVNGFDSSVAAAESTIQSFIAAGKKVLILEQNNSTVASSFNSSSWLGTAITLEQGGDDFVNIERPQISTLMGGLSRSDFRIWNNIGTTSLPDRSLMAYYLKLTGDDLNTTAVLANAGQHLSRAALVEIFPSGPASGSCILSQLRINSSDPLSMKFAANLFDYLTESVQHNQYIEVGPVMRFGKFKTEKGAICAPLLQGMFISASGEYYQIDGYAFRGPMYISNGLGYLAEADGGATRSICPMYVKFHFALGNTIVVDVGNPTASELQFRLKINGVTSAWTQVSPLERKLASIAVSPVAANTNIKLEIESDEGLIFYSMKFAEPDLCDVDEDGYVNFVDFTTAFQNWMESSI